MNEMLNIETIYRQERLRWMNEEAPHKSVREVIAESVPYWIILVALVLFGLSAPHTQEYLLIDTRLGLACTYRC